MRALVALVALGVIAVILWFFYSTQPHPLGTLAYDYLNEFPGFLVTLVIVGASIVLRMVFGPKRIEDFTWVTGREEDKSSKSVH